MTDVTPEDAWFYTLGGQRVGPVSANKLRELLAAQTIDGETPIWRKGMTNWEPARTTEFGAQLTDVPPPVAARHIDNGLAWALALAPLAYLVLEVVILRYGATQIIQWDDDAPIYTSFYTVFIAPLIWLVPILTNAGLCLRDSEQLKRAGYGSKWMTVFALLLAPVYLFVRGRRLRQTPTYGFVWIATFLVSLVLRVA